MAGQLEIQIHNWKDTNTNRLEIQTHQNTKKKQIQISLDTNTEIDIDKNTELYIDTNTQIDIDTNT